MSIVITGGAGFIGSHLVDYILDNTKENIVVIDNFSRGSSRNLNLHISNPRLKIIKASINDKEILIQIIRNNDLLFHLAAQASVLGSVKDESLTFTTNVIGTHTILEVAKEVGVKKIIFSSSREVYGEPEKLPVEENTKLNPKNAYGISKAINEMYCNYFTKEHNMDIRILRLSNVYGKRDFNRVIPIWIESAVSERPILIYGGNQVIDFIPINIVVKCLWDSAYLENLDTPINIGSGVGTPIKMLAKKICELVGEKENNIKLVKENVQEVTNYVADISKMMMYFKIDLPEDPLISLPELVLESKCSSRLR